VGAIVDIAAWLRDLELEVYEPAFRDNDIDLEVLKTLSADDLKELGISSLGHRKKLLQAAAALAQAHGAVRLPEPPAVVGLPPREAERRQLTVLFCDLVGSTELSAQLDPEDLGELMAAYQACCGHVVRRWGGYVARYLGDGALAYFGWPRAHEHDAERAVRAGLELTRGIEALRPKEGVSLRARVGIATGEVIVGELLGAGSARDEVMGETPNLAARLQALAAPGSVMIGPTTRRLVRGLFELDDLGPQHLKGFAQPLAVWRVAGETRTEGRFEAQRAAGLTPLVGARGRAGTPASPLAAGKGR
jgi:class 3 adenylate cyclase